MEQLYQVNVTDYVDGRTEAWISRYSEDGYRGTIVDTQYIDGCDQTEWCVFVGSREECEIYIEKDKANKQKMFFGILGDVKRFPKYVRRFGTESKDGWKVCTSSVFDSLKDKLCYACFDAILPWPEYTYRRIRTPQGTGAAIIVPSVDVVKINRRLQRRNWVRVGQPILADTVLGAKIRKAWKACCLNLSTM